MTPLVGSLLIVAGLVALLHIYNNRVEAELKVPKPCQKKCGKTGTSPHGCPYARDVHGDSTRSCNCCVECTQHCRDDI